MKQASKNFIAPIESAKQICGEAARNYMHETNLICRGVYLYQGKWCYLTRYTADRLCGAIEF